MSPRTDTQLHLRALLIAIGLYGAAALVWFLGPLLTLGGMAPLASERARGAAIAAVLALFALQLLWRTWRASRRNRQLLDGIVTRGAADPAAPGASEVAVIGKRFADAVAVLRNRRVGGARTPWSFLTRRPYVYELPWYILIGAPGAGKTTTIVNSGLQFPLDDKRSPQAVAGAGGTRNCDWWFTTEAVLIDTAGRYTTQDSYREADRAAWNGFLGQLALHRPRQPINGAILTLSVTDLLQPNAEKRQALAREMRGRIEELHQRLGIRFPIYVLVTKTDLLAGFVEFFADFDKDERAQVWGVTFPLEGDADAAARQARLGNELTTLEKTLNEHLFDRLRDEHDRERRAAIFAFPQQWRVLREALVEMVQATFDAPTLEAMPLLRGVYFTSATQEGSPVDRALGGLARAMGLAHRVLPAARPSGKSFFVTRLLREVIIGEAGLAGTNRRWERRRTWMHVGTVAASAVFSAGLIGWGWHVYADNRAWLAETARATRALRPQVAAARAAAASDLTPLVPLLDAVRAIEHDVLGSAPGRSPVAGLGLDQRDSVGAAAQDVYHHLLRESLLPRIASRLEQRLSAGQPDQVETLYEALKAYLMLFGGKNFNAAALRAFLTAEWDGSPASAWPLAIRKALPSHLDRLLATGEVGAPAQADAALVARTRELVAGVPLAERVYRRIVQSAAGDSAGAFSLESAAGPLGAKVLVRASGQPLNETVPALYGQAARRQGLPAQVQQVLRQFEQEAPWVLQPVRAPALDDAARAKLVEQIESRHAAEAQRVWDALLRDLRLAPTTSLASVAEQAQWLSRPDSPLLAVLVGVLREVGPEATAEPFASLRAYAMGQPAGYQPVHAALARVATQLATIDDAVARKAALPGQDALRELADATARTPEPVRALLQQLLSQAAAQSFAVMREPLNRLLQSEVTPTCTAATDGRYPFVRDAAKDASRDEVVRVFGPGGSIDGFFQRQLAGLLDSGSRASSLRGAEPGKAPALSADTVQAFQRAQAIRGAFFQDGARGLAVRLEMRLLELDPGIGQFLLDVDGQTLRFARDTRTAQSLQWPGAGGAGRVTLQAPAPGAPTGAGYSFDGPWSLLRLFERVRIEPGATTSRATVVFDIEGRRARFELRSPGGVLPIGLDLEQFQCPKRL